MAKNIVTTEYLMGITEGRSFLNHLKREDSGFVLTKGICLDRIQMCNESLKLGFSKTMSDVFRGERDFWKNQLAVLTGATIKPVTKSP